MPDTPSITLVKKFTYRGNREEYSNTYHFSGDVPSSDAAWKTLADAIWNSERGALPNTHSCVRAYGYEAGNELSVAQIDYEAPPLTTTSGLQNPSTGETVQAGDVAFWIRWRTPQRNSRGKWIYLRKYFHGAITPTSQEVLVNSQKVSAQQHATKMTDGTLPGGVKVCGPQGATAGAALVSPFVTTRTLKRRGKRPSS